MADFFDENVGKALDNEEVKQEEIKEIVETVKVGDKEYTQEELNKLVNLGNIATELETKWNTKIDKVYPAFTQSQNKLKEYEDKVKEYDKLVADKAKPTIPEDQQIAEAKRVLREQLGVILKDDLGNLGLINKQEFKNYYKQEREAEKILEQASDMETEINGADGRPAFKTQEVLEYAATNGITNIETAYKLMHEKELDAWKEQQLGKIKKPEFVTQEKATGSMRREPPSSKPKTEEELLKQLTESIYGPTEE